MSNVADSWHPPDLSSHICLVAGATRGAGRGMAVALGEAGATVYCTGRSSRESGSSAMGRSETIEESAELVDAAGGRGIAVRVDHSDADAVRGLVDKIRSESGGLDLLVNDIWGGDALVDWGKPFWESDPDVAWGVLENALRTHVNTAMLGAPLLRDGSGLLVEVTDGDSFQFRGNVSYDLIKTSVIRLAYGLAEDLEPRGVSAVALTPGFLRSEAMLEHFGVTEKNWRDGVAKDPHFVASETPMFVGRALASLAADPEKSKMSGRVLSSWGLSDVYGFPDADGEQPHWGRYFVETVGKEHWKPLDDAFYGYWERVPFA